MESNKDVFNLEEAVNELNHMDEITLMDTIMFMDCPDYRARFIAEYMQTKIRYAALHKMIIKHEAGTLEFKPACDISILEDQAYHMGNYLKQLEIRAEIEEIELPRM